MNDTDPYDIPDFKYHPNSVSTRPYVLQKNYTFYGTPHHDHMIELPNMKLNMDGDLTLRRRFRWDLGSGPAIDTPSMITASLYHDAICRLWNGGLVTYKDRRKADKYFRKLLIKFGAGRFRAWYCYLAVTLISYKLKIFNQRGRP